MTIKEYVQQLFDGVPQDVYLLLLAIFCLGTLLLTTFRGVRLGGRNAMALLLVEYVFLLYCSTVFFRGEAARGHNFLPFWSYVGCCISLLIEILQYVFKRGFSEFDDIFHNVIGCMIGYAVSLIVNRKCSE